MRKPLIDTFRRNNMYKLLIAAVLILASLAPASARQKAHNAAGKSNVVKAYKWNTTYTEPYIGDWKQGYPGSPNDC
jgi:opacity protein-like surface antigen